jgi:cation diffusion facilitator family transporter
MQALQQKQKVRVAVLSVASNTTLVVFKLVVGLAIGSVSVISEAIHSGMDLVAAIIALLAVRQAGQPADRDHAFGHGKVESISGAVEALLIFVAAIGIVWKSVAKLRHPDSEFGKGLGWGVAVMLLSSILNFLISRRLMRVGRETQSMALQADALHLSTDVWTSLGVMGGLGLIYVSEAAFPGRHFHWIDPMAAILVAGLIVHAAVKLTIQAVRDLMDEQLPTEETEWTRHFIETCDPRVRGFHHLRTRRSGPTRFIDFHLFVDPGQSVADSHHLAHEISGRIKGYFEGADVTVHVEPYDEEAAAARSIARAGRD